VPTVEQANWRVEYYLTESSGLSLAECQFNHVPVLYSGSVPFVYVNYIGGTFGPFTDELKSVSGNVEVREIVHGFDLKVTYDQYGADYQYDHIWRFHADGQFGSTIVIHGPGEEINGWHTYHLPWRFDLDISGAAGDSFQRWSKAGVAGGFWEDVQTEGRHTPSSAGWRYDWQVLDRATNRRAMLRAGEHDSGEVWALQYSDVENWSSWGGVQPKAPGSPGSVPALYSGGQSVQEADLVIWYIAHIGSRHLPATCGPWFKLEGFGDVDLGEDHHHEHDEAHH
jgi:hypothetical protein